MVIATKSLKPGIVVGPSRVCVKMISASGEAGVNVIMEFCQRVWDGKAMPEKWQINDLVPILKEIEA